MAENNPTRLLQAAADGKGYAVSELTPLVYDELRALAARRLGSERPGHTLQPTALVHEAYLRLIDQTRARYQDKDHFFAIAARTMRRVLIDHARGRDREKRGGEWHRVSISTRLEAESAEFDLLELDELLDGLAELNARHAQIAELRLFGDLESTEIAEALGVSNTTIKNEWRVARAWLQVQMRKR